MSSNLDNRHFSGEGERRGLWKESLHCEIVDARKPLNWWIRHQKLTRKLAHSSLIHKCEQKRLSSAQWYQISSFLFHSGFWRGCFFFPCDSLAFLPAEKLLKRTENDEKIEISIYFNCLIDAERQGRRKMKRSIAKFIHHSFHSYRSINRVQFESWVTIYWTIFVIMRSVFHIIQNFE